MDSKTLCSMIFLAITVLYFGLGALTSWLNLPVMKIDHLTRECLSVESNNPELNCGNQPKRYIPQMIAYQGEN